MKQIKTLWILGCVTLLSLFSCKKFVDIDPPQHQLVRESIFENPAGANSALLNIYQQMAFTKNAVILSVYPSLSSDEMINYTTDADLIQFNKNALIADNASINLAWSAIYTYIYQANAIVEGVAASGQNTTLKNQLIGEAKFVRAYWHFYLTNLFGDIPLVISTAYQENAQLPRTSKSAIYDQLISDLVDAESKMGENFVGADGLTTAVDRLRPNKYTAAALLAKVYLYKEDWVNAEKEASKVIASPQFKLETDLDKVFLIRSSEAVWQISYSPTFNAYNGAYFNLSMFTPGTVGPFCVGVLTKQMLAAFESGDKRMTSWVGSRVEDKVTYAYPNKYKVWNSTTVSEYEMVFRLAEQYLIRAEARAQQTNPDGAVSDIDQIRKRAGLEGYKGATDKASLLNAVLHERQVELFTESANRLMDLRRTKNLDAAMESVMKEKDGTWKSYQQWYPIPSTEIGKNKALVQNNGY